MNRLEREWMYERFDANKRPRKEYTMGVMEFIKAAKKTSTYKSEGRVRCPCLKCNNKNYMFIPDVENHLYSKGFCENYKIWIFHGEKEVVRDQGTSANVVENPYVRLVEDALRSTVDRIREEELNPDNMEEEIVSETPNPKVISFFEMLRNAERPLYEGSRMSLLEAAARLLTLKCEHNLSFKCVDDFASFLGDAIPKDNLMSRNFYEVKKVMKGLLLPVQKIDSCVNGCMLFWKQDQMLDNCSKCGERRYKSDCSSSRQKRVPRKVLTYFPVGPRLQRLYATKHLAGQMSWHYKNSRVRTKGTMAHPSDSEAWKHFDTQHPTFASEPRNVRLGLCTDGFAPHGQFGKDYSCWPVIVTPYNLPPWLCMKKQFMFLALIVPGPKNPKSNMDVYMQPLIEELKELWDNGVPTYDVSTSTNFDLKAALLWTINDFPAYGMLSGWKTSGYLACPYCPIKRSFWLKSSGKVSWFDCHRPFLPTNHPFRKNDKYFLKKQPNELRTSSPYLTGDDVWECVRHLPTVIDATDKELNKIKGMKEGWWKQSIFWQLPYWKTMLIRHNLDVMHIEKNFFEMMINTIMNNPKKTCFGSKGKTDFVEHCYDKRPTSSRFVLEKAEKKALCEWVSSLKFPDGYASDLSRCVDNSNHTLRGLKSHDCHVFMERLLPVAFKHLLPKNTWCAITEISQFFRDLCSPTIKVESMEKLMKNIPEILCKLEKIFPPSFFNSMEHLPVHLPYEAKVGGPVQYRWMYPFER